MGAEGEVEGPREGGGVGWLEVEDRAEVQGLAGGNQWEEGRGGASAAQHPPKWITLKEEGDEWVLNVACGRCGIIQHPTGTVKECPVGGCHVRCQGRFVRGCNPVDGKAFFRAMYEELVNPDT